MKQAVSKIEFKCYVGVGILFVYYGGQTNTAVAKKMVPSVYTHLIDTIYLSRSKQREPYSGNARYMIEHVT